MAGADKKTSSGSAIFTHLSFGEEDEDKKAIFREVPMLAESIILAMAEQPLLES